MFGRHVTARGLLLAVLIALAGCGDGDGGSGEEGATAAGPDVAAVEATIEEQLARPAVGGEPKGFTVEAASCPDDAIVAPGEEFECEAATSEGDFPVAVSLGRTYSYTGTVGTSAVGGTLAVDEPDLAAIEAELVDTFADTEPSTEVDCPDDADLEGEFACDVAPDGEVTIAAGVSLDWSTAIAGESYSGGADPLE